MSNKEEACFIPTLSVISNIPDLTKIFFDADETTSSEISVAAVEDRSFDGSINLINFQRFKVHGCFPRYPDQRDLTTTLDKINKESSLIVYISHRWLRATAACEEWNGSPDPDTPMQDKFKICVEGIEKLMQHFAPKLDACFLWTDFCCTDQNRNPGSQLKRLERIMECADCMFTPIVDKMARAIAFEARNSYADYEAVPWSEGPSA